MLSALLAACVPMTVRPAPDLPPPPAFIAGPVRIEQPRLAGVIVFADELHPVEDAAAGFLAEHGYTVLPRAEVAAVLAQTADCVAPPIPSRLLSHRFPNTTTARIEATCEAGCTVTLTTYTEPAVKPWGVTSRWAAPMVGGPTIEAVLAAIPMLVPVEDGELEVGLETSQRVPSTSRGVQARQVRTAGGWLASDLSAALESADLDACWASGRREPRDNPIALSVDASGAVTRCEPARSHIPSAMESDCACARLRETGLGAGAAERRGSFVPTSHQPPAVNAAGQIVSASLGGLRSESVGLTWTGAGVSSHALSACLARAEEAESADVTAQFVVGADGVPTVSEASWPAWVSQTQSCLNALLPTARFSCLSDGTGGEVTATIRIRVR
ncbi:MAG: hypothetical protein ACI8RZ_007233 [Myxococcota bacterium]|jgi:hypothetical protein